MNIRLDLNEADETDLRTMLMTIGSFLIADNTIENIEDEIYIQLNSLLDEYLEENLDELKGIRVH